MNQFFSETDWLVEDGHEVDIELVFVAWQKVLDLGSEDSSDFSVHECDCSFFRWFGHLLFVDLVSVVPLSPR